jgi:hypothetical protein
VTKQTAEKDKEMLNALERAGFKLNYGSNNAGFWMTYLDRAGRYCKGNLSGHLCSFDHHCLVKISMLARANSSSTERSS